MDLPKLARRVRPNLLHAYGWRREGVYPPVPPNNFQRHPIRFLWMPRPERRRRSCTAPSCLREERCIAQL